MAEPFDPYRKWLGIPPSQQPPHHYRLLGIELYEEDPEVIDTAASQRMSYLQELGGGQYVKESQRLLNEVSAARRCLLDKQRKAEYDAGLRAKLAKASPPKTPPKPPPVQTAARLSDEDDTVTVKLGELGIATEPKRRSPTAKPSEAGKPATTGGAEPRPSKRKRRSPLPMLIGLMLVIGAAAGGAVYVVLNRPGADVAGGAPPTVEYSAEELEPPAVVRPRETPAPRQVASLPTSVAAPSKPPQAAATPTPQPSPSAVPPSFFAPPTASPSATAVAAASSAPPRTPTPTPTAAVPKAPLDQSFFGVDSIALPAEVRAHFAPTGRRVRELCGFFRVGDEYHVYYDAVLRSPANTVEWGHVVSRDLFAWTEAAPLVPPVDAKLKPVLGSVLVDAGNVSGFGKNGESPWIAVFTYASSGDPAKGVDFGLAVSTDQGGTWKKTQDAPLLTAKEASARRVRLTYDAASRQWCLCWLVKTVVPPAPSSKTKTATPPEPTKTTYRLFSSSDLKTWKQLKEFEFQDAAAPATLAAVGDAADPTKRQWLFLTARGRYWLVEFDGSEFTTERQSGALQASGGYHGLLPLDSGGKPAEELVLLSLLTSAATTQAGAAEAAAFAIPRRLKMQGGAFLPSRDPLPAAWLGAAQSQSPSELLADAPPVKVRDAGGQFRLQLLAEPDPTAVFQVTIFGVPLKFNLPNKTWQLGGRTPAAFPSDRVQIDGWVDDHLVELSIGGVGLIGFDAPTGPDTNTPLELRSTGGKTRLSSLTLTPLKPPKPAARASSAKQ